MDLFEQRLTESRAAGTTWICPCGDENPGSHDLCATNRHGNPDAEILAEEQP